MSPLFKIFLIGLMGLAIASATKCHNSCVCAPNSNVCDSCSDPNGDADRLIEFGYRYCPCSFGYYTSSISPFTCTPIPDAEDMDSCELVLVGQIIQLILQTDCKAVRDGNLNFVESAIDLDRFNLIKGSGCVDSLVTTIYYRDPLQPGNPLVKFPSTIWHQGVDGTKQYIRIPLGDLDTYSIEQSKIEGDQITNTIDVVIEMGHTRKVIRRHKYQIFVFTNRDQVQTFKIDVDVQETEGCQLGQECIVIADLDTKAQVYTDNTYTTVKAQLLYQVGDIFYAQILFKDPTYTKKLLFDNLYFKTSTNKIYDFTSITTHSSFAGGLNIALPLVYPSNGAVIQVNMRVGSTRLRALIDTQPSTNTQFIITTTDKDSTTPANSESNNASIIAFSLFALLLLFV